MLCYFDTLHSVCWSLPVSIIIFMVLYGYTTVTTCCNMSQEKLQFKSDYGRFRTHIFPCCSKWFWISLVDICNFQQISKQAQTGKYFYFIIRYRYTGQIYFGSVTVCTISAQVEVLVTYVIWSQIPGAELLEIRYQASHSQVLEAPSTLFAFLSVHPHRHLY